MDPSDTCMQVWIRPEYDSLLLFIVTTHPSNPDTLTGFHMLLQIVCMESAKLLYCVLEAVTGIVNTYWGSTMAPHTHSPDAIYDTRPDPDDANTTN